MKKRSCVISSSLVLGGILSLLLLGVLAAGLIYYSEYQTSARLVEGPRTNASIPSRYNLTPDQQALVAESGYPESFSLLFYDEELADGSQGTIRYEVWDYYTQDKQYVFVNGELTGEQALDAGEVSSLPTGYRPEQFLAYMSLDEVVTAAQVNSYLVVPLEKSLLPGGQVYYTAGLAFGLKDNQLLYVETFIGEEGG
jgi:hypothetical protein